MTILLNKNKILIIFVLFSKVILPYLTETYGNLSDPNDEGGDIPVCTLKMFPE
jgi:hypothetical protein